MTLEELEKDVAESIKDGDPAPEVKLAVECLRFMTSRIHEETDDYGPNVIIAPSVAVLMAIALAHTETSDDFITEDVHRLASMSEHLALVIRNIAFPEIDGEHAWRKRVKH